MGKMQIKWVKRLQKEGGRLISKIISKACRWTEKEKEWIKRGRWGWRYQLLSDWADFLDKWRLNLYPFWKESYKRRNDLSRVFYGVNKKRKMGFLDKWRLNLNCTVAETFICGRGSDKRWNDLWRYLYNLFVFSPPDWGSLLQQLYPC